MDSTYAALLGAVIGGTLSVLASWLAQRVQSRTQSLTQEIQQRQLLYSDFIETAARCYADALRSDEPNAARLAKLYADMGRMRIHSSDEVVKAANLIAHKILDAYAAANRSPAEIREFLENDSIDLFTDFGNACRTELERLRPVRIVRAHPSTIQVAAPHAPSSR